MNNIIHDEQTDEPIASPAPPDELTVTQQKADEYLGNWKRAQADLINYRKEEGQRMQEFLKFAVEGVILDMLDIYDTFEMVVKHAPPDVREQEKNWFQGVEQTIKQFIGALQKFGAKRIITAGAFDAALHEAVDDEGKTDEVMEEVRSGWTLAGKVIRPARVRFVVKNNSK